tara:strand:+ start:384 stop:1142 length:759 start_codon:yes stop_codon:yes gene_type:complete
MRNELVSVIIPYFRKRNFLTQTIESLNKQTYKKKEIIIIYDDYDKSDLNFIKKIIKKKKNYKLIINKSNIGAGRSRNRGIKASKGKYVAFLDSDDLWSKNKLKKQINFMSKNKISASFTAYDIINEKNKKIGSRAAEKRIFYNDLLLSCNIGLSTVVLKKSLLKGKIKFPSLKTKEDYVLWLLLSKKKIIFYGINESLSFWRKTDTSLSSDTIQKLIDGFMVYYKYMNFSIFKSLKHLILLSLNYLKKLNFF